MREPIESEYFNWLCAKVRKTSVRVYIDILRILHQTEFPWIVPGDKNRAEDGIELRTHFLREVNVDEDPSLESWLTEPCSVLEMLYGFAIRASFQTDIRVVDWFWTFLNNLGLDEFRQVSAEDEPIIQEILSTFVWRTYDDAGNGNIFPMRYPKHDQRQVEIWYQFCDYLEDQGMM